MDDVDLVDALRWTSSWILLDGHHVYLLGASVLCARTSFAQQLSDHGGNHMPHPKVVGKGK